MKLENQFTVRASLDATWRLLTDLERIAPCMPGAELLGRDGDVWQGRVRVKLGPVLAQYEGRASFVERDEVAKRGVLRAEGRETKGQGSAKATVTASLAAVADGTRVVVETDLAIVGRLAQLGRGLIAEVSAKLLNEFVANLERLVLAGAAPAELAVEPPAASAGAAAGSAAAAASAVAPDSAAALAPSAPPPAAQRKPPAATRTGAPAEVPPVDLLATAALPLLKRLLPLAIGVAVLVALAIALL